MDSLKNIPIFFIIGRPRSGTTLIRTMLDAHPNVNIPVECPLVVNLYHKYKKVKKWNRQQREKFHSDLLNQWKFSSWTIDSEKLKTDILDAGDDISLADLIKIAFINYKSFYPKESILILGDKNPIYSLKYSYMKTLHKVFPEAKFLHITRDYRDNFLSYKRVDFEAPIPSLICYRWKHSAKAVDKLKKRAGRNFFTFRYEDLILNAGEKLMEICRFLEIEYNPCMHNYHEKKDDFIKQYSSEIMEKYHKNAMTPVNSEKAFEWKEKMPDSQVKIADYAVGKKGEQLGYEKKYRHASILTMIRAFPGICYGKFWFLLSALVDSMPYAVRNSVISKGPVMAWVYGKIFGKKRS